MTPDEITRSAQRNDQITAAYCDQVINFYAAVFKSYLGHGLERAESLELTKALIAAREGTRSALLCQDEINRKNRASS